jgi:hypothetical protein
MEAFQVIRYGTQKLLKGGKMTPAERAVANIALKRWARIASTQIGIVGANYAFAKAMGLQLPNVTDPTKANFMRMRIGNFIVPLSPLMEAIREPIRAAAVAIQKRDLYEGGKELIRPVLNAIHPTAGLVIEQATGKEPYTGRPIPSVRNLIQPLQKSNQPAESGLEYISTRVTPIAISGALREYYQALRNEGVSATDAMAFIKGASGGLASGLAGTHVYEETPKELTPKGKIKPVSKVRQIENARIKLY